jgi:hypothetical protein
LDDLGINRRVLLKWMLRTLGRKVWDGFVWFRVSCCECGNGFRMIMRFPAMTLLYGSSFCYVTYFAKCQVLCVCANTCMYQEFGWVVFQVTVLAWSRHYNGWSEWRLNYWYISWNSTLASSIWAVCMTLSPLVRYFSYSWDEHSTSTE